MKKTFCNRSPQFWKQKKKTSAKPINALATRIERCGAKWSGFHQETEWDARSREVLMKLLNSALYLAVRLRSNAAFYLVKCDSMSRSICLDEMRRGRDRVRRLRLCRSKVSLGDDSGLLN